MEPSAEKRPDDVLEKFSASGKQFPDRNVGFAKIPGSSPSQGVTHAELTVILEDFSAQVLEKINETDAKRSALAEARWDEQQKFQKAMLTFMERQEGRSIAAETPEARKPVSGSPTFTQLVAPLHQNIALRDVNHRDQRDDKPNRTSRQKVDADEDVGFEEDDIPGLEFRSSWVGGSSTSKDRRFKSVTKGRPRESILKELVQQSDNPRSGVQFVETRPSDKHIRLTELTVKAVKKFADQIVEYQTVHGLVLPVSTLIDSSVRDFIIANNKGLNNYNFHLLKTPAILTLLQETIRPPTVLDFQRVLASSVEFPQEQRYQKPTAIAFRAFHDAVLVYRKNFITIFEILAENNEENIPSVNNKDGGLIKIFVDKIPYKYGDNFVKSRKDQKYATIHDFIDDFEATLAEHYQLSKSAKSMQQFFGGSDYFDSFFSNKKLVQNNVTTPKKSFDRRSPAADRIVRSPGHRLHHLDVSAEHDIEAELSQSYVYVKAYEENADQEL